MKPPLFRAAIATLALLSISLIAKEPRERIPLNNDWRFQKGDPADLRVNLNYDVRPEVSDKRDDINADAKPTEAQQLAGAQDVLKAWILPTGNAFIKDPTRRHLRPAGHPGSKVAFVQPDFDDSTWQRVTLPHDWAIAGPFLETGPHGGMGRLPSDGIGWYRRKLAIPATDAGKRLFLDVDGAMSYATVWLNGKLVGGWPYGYSSWRVDLTPYVNFGGDNQLAIRLDNPPNSSRWYPGAGIYRNVWLTKTQPVHVAHWGTKITTPQVSASAAKVEIRTKIDNVGSPGTELEFAL